MKLYHQLIALELIRGNVYKCGGKKFIMARYKLSIEKAVFEAIETMSKR